MIKKTRLMFYCKTVKLFEKIKFNLQNKKESFSCLILIWSKDEITVDISI